MAPQILFLGSSPVDDARPPLMEEYEEIAAVLRRWRDPARLNFKFGVQARDLARLIMLTKPRVLHFSGHGNDEGELVFRDRQRRVRPADAALIQDLFGGLGSTVRCVVLNGCFSRPQAELIAAQVDAVVGMTRPLGHDRAIAFSQGFYDALGLGNSIDEAFEQGQWQLDLPRLPDDCMPVLLRAPGAGKISPVAG